MRVSHRKSLYVRSASCLLRSSAALVLMPFLISISFRWLTYVITCFSSTLYFVQKLLMVSQSYIILSECSSSQIFNTFSREIVIWCPAYQIRWIDIHEMFRIVWVWHRLRNSLRFWADPPIVRAPRTEIGTSFSWLPTGFTTEFHKEFSTKSGLP